MAMVKGVGRSCWYRNGSEGVASTGRCRLTRVSRRRPKSMLGGLCSRCLVGAGSLVDWFVCVGVEAFSMFGRSPSRIAVEDSGFLWLDSRHCWRDDAAEQLGCPRSPKISSTWGLTRARWRVRRRARPRRMDYADGLLPKPLLHALASLPVRWCYAVDRLLPWPAKLIGPEVPSHRGLPR